MSVRLARLQARHVRDRLRRPIRHAGHARDANDTFLVRAEMSDGSVGWGESLPRNYVTGETIESTLAAWETRCNAMFDALSEPFPDGPAASLVAGRLPRPGRIDRNDRDAATLPPSLRAAVEIAFLDAAGRSLGLSLSRLLVERPTAFAYATDMPRSVRYGVVFPLTRPSKLRLLAVAARGGGIRDVKLKVGRDHTADLAAVKLLKRWLGPAVDLRVDANGAWPVESFWDRLRDLADAGVSSVEQPLADADRDALFGTRGITPIPVLLDESLADGTDADDAIARGLGDGWNVRVSKCGGVLPALDLLAAAGRHAMPAQLGCMVGETGVLSAAGRHVAAAATALGFPPRHVEGSYDRFLVRDRLTREDMTFGFGGWGRVPIGPGLGVSVDEAAVARLTIALA